MRVLSGRSVVSRVAAAMLVLAAIPAVGAMREADGLAAPPVGASAFVPVAPLRLVDTRQASCGCTVTGVNEFALQVTGQATVPVGATAAVMTLTMTAAGGQGYLSAWPTGAMRPVISSTNVTKADQTVANTQIVPLSASGSVSVYTSVASYVLVDIVGYFMPAPAVVTAGRYLPTSPLRLADTRQVGGGGLMSAGSVRTYDPRTIIGNVGYSAVAINLTMAGTGGWGFLTAWQAGQTMPTTSTVNADAVGETRAAFTIVPTSSLVSVFAGNSTTHLIIDIIGVFTDGTAISSQSGLFVPVTPTRWIDTRQAGGGGAFAPNETRTYTHTGVAPSGSAAIPSTAGAMVGNVTMTGAAPGFVTAYRADIALPATSTVNTSSVDTTMANGVVISLSSSGAVAVTSSTVTHLVIDYTGWFTASPALVPPTPTTTTTTTIPAGTCVVIPLSAPAADVAHSSFNEWRAEVGAAPLTVSPKLTASACEWAKLLYSNNGLVPGFGSTGHSSSIWLCTQWGYTAPLYLGCPNNSEVIGGAGGATASVAEDIQGMQSTWYFSPGHHDTAVNATFMVAGYVGVCGPDPLGQRCWFVGQFAVREP